MSPKQPFTILRDSQEKVGFFTFANLHTRNGREVVTRWHGLGPRNGDYSIPGEVGRCAIERKSIEDCVGTVLGWGERRERFERELANLEQMQTAAVVVVGSQDDVEASILAEPQRGTKTPKARVKEFAGAVRALQQDFRVPWVWCSSHRRAEIETLRILERHGKYASQRRKRLDKAERILEVI